MPIDDADAADAQRERRRREDEASAIARLRDAYGDDASLLELVERVVHGSTSRRRAAPLTRSDVIDGLWAITAARRELDRLEALLLIAAPKATPKPLRQWEVAEPLGVQQGGISGRLRRLRPLIDQELLVRIRSSTPVRGLGT